MTYAARLSQLCGESLLDALRVAAKRGDLLLQARNLEAHLVVLNANSER